MIDYIKKLEVHKISNEEIIKLIPNEKYRFKLDNCCRCIDEHTDGSYFLAYPCNLKFCAVCTWLKAIKAFAIACKVYGKLIESKPKPVLYLLTLTVEECGSDQARDVGQHIKESFRRLRRIKRVENVLLGSSLYIHFGLNKTAVTPHAHVILALRPSFIGKQFIKIDEFQALWQAALQASYLPHIDFRRIGKPDKNQLNSDFASAAAYCTKAIKQEKIKLNPKIFNELIENIKGFRKISHTGLLKELRSSVNKDYKEDKLITKADNQLLTGSDGKEVKSRLTYRNKTYEKRANPLLVAEEELEEVVEVVLK